MRSGNSTRKRGHRQSVVWAVLVALVGCGLPIGSWQNTATGKHMAAGHQHITYTDQLLIQLSVSDLEQSIAFYRDVLELKLSEHRPELEWAKFKTNIPGVQIGIGRQDTVKGSGTTSINISVSDVDAARKTLESRGVVFTGATINIPGVVKLATFADPDGNRLRLAGPPDLAATSEESNDS